jgi:hypothetical protein
MKTIQERARNYALKMPPSIQGSGGSNDAFNVAAVLAVGFDLADEDALRIMEEWNQGCQPLWSERELLGKLASARRDCKRPPGYLLGEVPKPNIPEAPARFHTESLTLEEARTFADARGLPMSAMKAAIAAGFAKVGVHSRYGRHLAIGEGEFRQLRRFNNQPFQWEKRPKAINFQKGPPQFIGASWVDTHPNILLVEGVVGWLEAAAAIHLAGASDFIPLAAFNCYSTFAKALPVLGALAGRRVLIVPDAGEKGEDAAKLWRRELEAVGCRVQYIDLPEGVGDLGELLRLPDALQFLNDELKYISPTPKP